MSGHYPSTPFHLGFEAFRRGKTNTPPANRMPTSKRKAKKWADEFQFGYSVAQSQGGFFNEE
jgi:hypothetical protein